MKMSTLILASLMTLTSAAAFAEGGAERSKEFYNNFSFIQEKTHGKAEQQVANSESNISRLENELETITAKMNIPEFSSDESLFLGFKNLQDQLNDEMSNWESFNEELELLLSQKD